MQQDIGQKIFFAILFSSCTFFARATLVRVLIHEQLIDSESVSLLLNSANGFTLRSDSSGASAITTTDGSELAFCYQNGRLWCNNKKLRTQQVRIVPRSGECTVNGCTYVGEYIVTVHDGKLLLINIVDLEDYVFSVVRWESWPGWPLEVNKAFAIIARTYVVEKVFQRKQLEKKRTKVTDKHLFDIRATNIHQTYKGVHAFDEVRQAVDQTTGIVIAYQNKPILAMYDACCGGVIPYHVTGFDFKAAPYLARTYPCTFCSSCKLFSWKMVYTRECLQDLLLQEIPAVKKGIQSIKVHRKDKAGKVQEIVVKTHRGSKSLSGNKFYSLCKDIKSFCYTISHHPQGFLVEGVGYGHHLGMCQWGARQMVNEGWLCKDILSFYYPGTHFMRIVHGTLKTQDSSHAAV